MKSFLRPEYGTAAHFFLAFTLCFTETFAQNGEMNYKIKPEVNWFTDSRFGMFIHWTPAGVLDKEIGWTWGTEISPENYIKACTEFNPSRFNADEWVRLAKDAGMKYIVLVTKHHDGFSLWNTEATDFNIMNSLFNRDVCKELSEACKKYDIAFCTYYSIADIYQNGWPHMYGVDSKDIPLVKGGMEAYAEFVKKQCAELIKKYDTKNFWFDGFWHPEWYDSPEYREKLYNYIKSLNSDIIIARLQMPTKPEGGWWDDGWDFEKNLGDYHSREDHGGKEWEKLYYKGPWEFCSSISYPYYSYNSHLSYKTAKECIQTLVKIAGRNGNYLLDISPKPDGSIDTAQIKILLTIGEWTKHYGEAIYGTEGGPFLPVSDKFACTRKANKIYLHILDDRRYIVLPPLGAKFLSAKIFGTTETVKIENGNDKVTYYIPENYANEYDIIIELVINSMASDISLIAPELM